MRKWIGRTFIEDKKIIGGFPLRNLLNKKLNNEKGMTLIELLAVIVILAIIALIAIPAIGNIISNSKSKAILADATTIISGAKTAIADGSCGPEKEGAITCDKTALKDFVEDTKGELDTDDKVVKTKVDGKAVYTITYNELTQLNDKYSDLIKTGSKKGTIKSATQKDVAKAMGNK
ncbi:putative major pilin subunit [Kurthia zopfii]|nr:putative major pilin subunit [Kurthia zopfii]